MSSTGGIRGARARISVRTSLGDFEVVASPQGLRSVAPLRRGGAPRSRPLEGPALDHARAAAEALRRYAAGQDERYEGRLDLAGSAFHRALWERLRAIPFGATTTYGEMAAALGLPGEARAVAAAVAANPACILIPCHRVVGSDGSLKGFAWGLELKRRLLAHEGRATLPLFGAAAS